MAKPNFLIQLVLSDPLAFQRFARDERLPAHAFDEGYAVHCLLGRLFGDDAPKPFAIQWNRSGELLAYSTLDHQDLESRAKMFAPPEAWNLVDWSRFLSKPMPAKWPEETRLTFTVKACPIVRGPSGHGKTAAARKSAPEVDAYLARVWRTGEGVSRDEVYREWLEREMERDGAAHLLGARVRSFRLGRFVRRDRSRSGRRLTRPEVRFDGVVRVADSEAFNRLLGRGVGRHRAFGFGMLLLGPGPGS